MWKDIVFCSLVPFLLRVEAVLPLSEEKLKLRAGFHFKGREIGHRNQVKLLGAY